MVLDCLKIVKTCVITQDLTKEGKNHHKSESPSVKEKEDLEYNPHDYGKDHHPTIFWGPVLHLLKTIIGTGVLALPHTFKSVGYGVAIVGTLLTGYMYVHVLHLLLEVEYHLCKKLKIPNLTYLEVIKHSFEQGPRMFKKSAPIFTSLMYVNYVFNKSLTNTVYLITIGGNFKIIIDYYCNTDLNLVTVMSFVIIPLILLCSIRNLKFLVPLSIVTTAFNAMSLILILIIPTNYDGSSDLKSIADVTQFPRFFGIVLGALSATGIILPLKNDMKNPKKFSALFGVMNIAFSVSTVAFGAFGVLAYTKYGDQLKPNVLHNLPPGSLISQLVISLYSLALFISFTLFHYIGFDTLWSNIFINKKLQFPLFTEYSLRITLCILPYIIAVGVPDFKIMLTLVGVISILMDKTIPPVLHILMLMKTKERNIQFYLNFLKDICLILISLLLFVAASISVTRSIINFYKG